MDIAQRASEDSSCVKKKVGAVLLTVDLIPIIGYNGTASGDDNVCELSDGTTNPEVLHAESNAFSKIMRAGLSTKDSTLYVTFRPCLDCAKLAYQAGVKRVVYKEIHESNNIGLDYLLKRGIMVEQFKEQED